MNSPPRQPDGLVSGTDSHWRAVFEKAERHIQFQASIIDHVRNAIAATDLDFKIVLWNRFAEDLYQWTEAEVLGKNVLDVVVPESQRSQADPIIEELRRAGHWEGEFLLQRKDGGQFPAYILAALLKANDGTPIGFAGAATDISERKKAESELREYSERLQVLSHRLIEVQEAERRHLARELHDEIGQELTALRFLLMPGPDAGLARLEEARRMVDALLLRVRELSFHLRPAMLDHLGLLDALLSLFESFGDRTGIQVQFKHVGLEGRFAPVLETAAYRIVQEALTNVARHASVKEVTVRVWRDEDALGIQVEDEGAGFESREVSLTRSSGLAGMQERVNLLGGSLNIESDPGTGTQVTARLPLGPSEGSCRA